MKTLTLKMRDSPNYFRDGGQRGDHRMVKLVIPLPKERLPEIVSCVALFSCDDELVLSPIILPGDDGDCYIKDGKAHIVLWQRLTQCWVLRVQLECYGDTEGAQFINRTAISEPVVFSKSLTDSINTDYLPAPSAITELLEAMHRHGNMTILEELGDLAGGLTYHGEALVPDALTNTEINELINQALAALV
jgi:hypothetical protein